MNPHAIFDVAKSLARRFGGVLIFWNRLNLHVIFDSLPENVGLRQAQVRVPCHGLRRREQWDEAAEYGNDFATCSESPNKTPCAPLHPGKTNLPL